MRSRSMSGLHLCEQRLHFAGHRKWRGHSAGGCFVAHTARTFAVTASLARGQPRGSQCGSDTTRRLSGLEARRACWCPSLARSRAIPLGEDCFWRACPARRPESGSPRRGVAASNGGYGGDAAGPPGRCWAAAWGIPTSRGRPQRCPWALLIPRPWRGQWRRRRRTGGPPGATAGSPALHRGASAPSRRPRGGMCGWPVRSREAGGPPSFARPAQQGEAELGREAEALCCVPARPRLRASPRAHAAPMLPALAAVLVGPVLSCAEG
mmetsp:Transcript_44686/g.140042  ORF Transcript_44686/g.140042 Transcript_44686/m.140042 type:complete len:266 (+) Transcript_44686:342-1139(+)